jgi:rRNA biogenesis protein RRP5
MVKKVKTKALLPQVEMEEVNFPRGRARQQSSASTSTAFEESKGKRQRKSSLSKKEDNKGRGKKRLKMQDLTSMSEIRTGSAGATSVDQLRLRDICEGAKVWACVLTVTSARVTVALPHGLRGVIEYLPKVEDKDKDKKKREPQAYEVGQLLRCVVLKLDLAKKRVALTASLESLHGNPLSAQSSDGLLRPGEIVPAFVESEEDHGWTLSFGPCKGRLTGFLPKDEGEEETKKKKREATSSIQAKSVVDVAVVSVDKRGVVKCSIDKTLLSTQVAQSHSNLSLHDLIPGMLVKCSVKLVAAGGLVVTFMSYFTGTIETSHLPKMLSEYKTGSKFQARILYVDSDTKTCHLTCLDHLMDLSHDEGNVISKLPKTGTLVDKAHIIGIDDKLGLLLKLELGGGTQDAFCHASNVADKAVEKLSQTFSAGQEVNARVIGYRPMENMVNVTLKESVLEQQILSHEDVQPGSTITGTVVAVRDFGLIVEITKTIRGVCPIMHMSDVTKIEPNWGKYKVNSKVKCLVVDCDPNKQKITLSLKRSLVKSDLPRICSLNMKLQDTVSHGVVTGIESYGLFVQFCGGVKGLAHVSELGLSANESAESCFDIGQVVKCRVIGVRKARKQLILSLQTQTPQNFESDFKVGTTGSMKVNKILENDIECTFVTKEGEEQGALIHISHLSDNVNATKMLKDWLENNFRVDNVMVLNHGTGTKLRLTRKASLLAIGSKHAKSIKEVKRGSIMRGYIHRIMPNKCLVKFLGNLIGVVPKSQILENFVVDPSNHVCLGQSVCCQVMDINEGDGSLLLSLKNEEDQETKGDLLASMWKDTEIAYRTSVESGGKDAASDFENLHVGAKVSCKVNSKKDYGVVCDINGHSDLLGLITHDHATEQLTEDVEITATVLHFDKLAGYVDLSMKPGLSSFQDSSSGSGDSLQEGESVDAVIQLVHENCLVASIPTLNNAIAFVCFKSINQQLIDSHEYFHPTQKIKCSVFQLPSESTQGRLILETKPVKKKALSKKGGPHGGRLAPGTWTTGVVESVQLLHITMRLKNNVKGRLHITELGEDDDISDLACGKEMKVRILGWDSVDSSHYRHFEVSTRKDTELGGAALDIHGNKLGQGNEVTGIIQGIHEDHIWVAFSRNVRGRLHILESSTELADLRGFKKRFHLGDEIQCKIVKADADFKNIDLTLTKGKRKDIAVGGLVCGIVTKISELSIQIQVSSKKFGRIFITDAVTKENEEKPFEDIRLGQIMSCKVLEIQQKQIELGFTETVSNTDAKRVSRRVKEYQVGQDICGYVKNVTSKGCFVSLSRHLHAHIKLKNLASTFVKEPSKKFPRGKFVRGRVITIDEGKNQMEVTLKEDRSNQGGSVSDVSEGDILRGRITRLEKYGAFCLLEEKRLTGLIHISELGTDYVKQVSSVVSVGDEVEVAVVKVEEAKNRVFLTMKGFGKIENDMEDDDDEEGYQNEEKEEEKMDDEVMFDLQNQQDFEGDLSDDSDDDELEQKRQLVSQMKAAAAGGSGPVAMETEDDDLEDDLPSEQPSALDQEPREDLSLSKRGKKKERDVRAAELGRITGDHEPSSKADYERSVLTSPNDSYTWISYMAFLLSLREVDEARKVAERALETINYREQEEKHNVWVAYLNLEFEHGSPNPEEAAMHLFQRGLPYNDGKKFHLALLSILQEKGKDEMAQQLLTTMCKKFRESPDVWLASIEYHVSQGREKLGSKVMDRSLKSLEDTRDQTMIISKSALLYYKYQYHEQARHMFESILKSYPKRTDLWNVYIDQEIKLKEHQRIKNLFERITHMEIPVKKMKFIFKKYMDYEMQHGTDESIEQVKQKAMEYVQSKM